MAAVVVVGNSEVVDSSLGEARGERHAVVGVHGVDRAPADSLVEESLEVVSKEQH